VLTAADLYDITSSAYKGSSGVDWAASWRCFEVVVLKRKTLKQRPLHHTHTEALALEAFEFDERPMLFD
jgi:hypothetical protein